MKAISAAPLLCLCFIFLFLCTIPSLGSMRPHRSRVFTLSRPAEFAAVALITVLYAVIAFYGLGSFSAPRTFLTVQPGTEVILEADGTYDISSVSVWSALGTGTCSVDISADGSSWQHFSDIDQNYAQLLRWHALNGTDPEPQSFRYLRFLSDRNIELGEAAVFTPDHERVPWLTSSVLTDEQSIVPEESDYMNSSYFDEIYHARTAWEHIRNMQPYEISHPPLGKLIISLGILLFGMVPFGWRFMGTLFGVLMIPCLYAFAKKLYNNGFAAMCTALLLASDFMHFNQTRIATIDTYSVFFIILMYLFMYRYWEEERGIDLFLSGLFFGLGCASKWTCIYAGGGLAVLWGIKRYEMRDRGLWDYVKNCMFCLVAFVALPFLIYYCSYWRYGTAAGLHGPGMFLSGDYFRIFAENQSFMFNYHSGINATHPYSSRWYQWVLNIRPILYYLHYGADGTRSTFGAFMNPLLCWSGIIFLLMLVYPAFSGRDRRALFLIIGYLAQLVPWTFVSRITFEYHYFPSSVFLILAAGLVFDHITRGRKYGRLFCGAFTAVSVSLFAFFYPVLEGLPIATELITKLYRWLPTWPF